MRKDGFTHVAPGRCFVFCTLLLCSVGAAMANADDRVTPKKLIQIDITPGRIAWTMQPNNFTWTLSVAGPNYYQRRIVLGGEVAQWSPVGADGMMPDGYYTWEFRSLDTQFDTPQVPGQTAQQLGAPRRQDTVQSGGFRVRDGLFVVPVEETSEASRSAEPQTAQR